VVHDDSCERLVGILFHEVFEKQKLVGGGGYFRDEYAVVCVMEFLMLVGVPGMHGVPGS
jgi:hypothetical protein